MGGETSSDEIVHEMDLLPTLATIAGGEVPVDRPIDGHDMTGSLWARPAARAATDSSCTWTTMCVE